MNLIEKTKNNERFSSKCFCDVPVMDRYVSTVFQYMQQKYDYILLEYMKATLCCVNFSSASALYRMPGLMHDKQCQELSQIDWTGELSESARH